MARIYVDAVGRGNHAGEVNQAVAKLWGPAWRFAVRWTRPAGPSSGLSIVEGGQVVERRLLPNRWKNAGHD